MIDRGSLLNCTLVSKRNSLLHERAIAISYAPLHNWNVSKTVNVELTFNTNDIESDCADRTHKVFISYIYTIPIMSTCPLRSLPLFCDHSP